MDKKRKNIFKKLKHPRVQNKRVTLKKKNQKKSYPVKLINRRDFPIVAIGASAGGLECFKEFFSHTASDTGIAFVLISHLDPLHVSMLSEIIQRTTKMIVVEAVDQMTVEPNCVYVIPPNYDMAIFQRTLQLSAPVNPKCQRLPIDFFLRSLADEQRDKAIGIILSGTGSDGSLGLKAIYDVGGVSFVQDPITAKYDGMPNAAVHSGLATYVLPLEKIPGKLLYYVRTLFGKKIKTALPMDVPTDVLNKILLLVRTSTGHDFSLYKKTTISRRIERRMAVHGISKVQSYLHYLQDNPIEAQVLFKEMLINVTNFFRNVESFVVLKKDILPKLFQNKDENSVFRAWVPGCSTGEEAYSIAMVLREYMDKRKKDFKIKIYATDINAEVIATARTGFFPHRIAEDISSERLRRFFSKEGSGYRVKKDIREMIVFAVQNVIKDPPFTKLDMLSCRNLLIYLEPELQERLISMFYYALNASGILFLSSSESVGKFSDLFLPINRKQKIFQVKKNSLPSPMKIAQESFRRMNKKNELLKASHISKQNKLKSIVEQYPQIFNEDLRSTNEELQSANEELQSANEELESSKEELQSLNEELVTVNAEFQEKIEQLFSAQNDMKNLVDSTNIATIFLDANFIIRRFTKDAAEIFCLVPTDVGRLLNNIKSNIDTAELLADAQRVLESLIPKEKEVLSIEGSYYLVRITPYRTLDNVIAGVVITFVNISKLKRAEVAALEAQEYAENIVATVREPLIVLDDKLKIVSVSKSFYDFFGVTAEETLGCHIYEFCHRYGNVPQIRELLENVLPKNKKIEDVEVECNFSQRGIRKIRLNAQHIVSKADQPRLILLAIEDVTEPLPTS